MKQRMKNKMVYIGTIMILIGACSSDEDKTYCPRTQLGKMVSQSDIVEEVYSDRTYVLRDGVRLTELAFRVGEDRQHVFITEVDLTKVTFTPGTKDDRNVPADGDDSDAILPIHALAAEANSKTVWVGINGDFYAANPLRVMGLFFKDGVNLNSNYVKGHEAVLYMLKSGEAYIGLADEALAHGDKLWHALGGYGTLMNNGTVNVNYVDIGTLATEVNPRTSVGISQDRKTLYLLVADGRRKDAFYANGLSLKYLAVLMKSVGCYNAINLDGGGSTTLIVRNLSEEGRLSFPILNTPADDRVPREVTNSLLIIEKNKKE